MENQNISKPECQLCGRKVSATGRKLSSIEFRRKVNAIKSLQGIIDLKDYFALFVKSRYKLKLCVDTFLEKLDVEISHSDPDDEQDIENIKLWIFSYQDFAGMLLENEPENFLYTFLRTNYTELNDSFHDFYDNYSAYIENPLNKNHVSRALRAFGIKTAIKKIMVNDHGDNIRVKCAVLLQYPAEELAELFRKNGF